jgi:hypothetical protein
MNKRPLAPKFLNKLDNSLLLNRPDTWSTRFHLVIYYSLLFMLVFTAICFVIPTDHREKSFFGLWSGSAGVLAFIGFILWLVYLLRFNVFKQFGTVFPGDRIKTFVLYFIMITMMSIVVYIPPVVESIRADHAYTSNELATDINRINEIVVGLERDRIPDVWTPDTLIRNYGNLYPQDENYHPGREYLDTASFNSRVRYADSTRRIGEGVVISYHFMNLRFIEDQRITSRSTVHVKSSEELYKIDYKSNQNLPSSAKAELQKLLDKYAVSNPNDYYYDYENNSPDLRYSILEKYKLDDTGRGIDHIADRKYRLQEIDYEDFIRGTYYLALVLTLFVFIFRHSTIKTFFLSLLVGVVLSILSGLFAAVLNLREAGIFGLMLFYYAAFVVISMLIFSAKKRSIVSGVALNAFALMTAFIPLICVALYYTNHHYEYYYNSYVYSAEYYATKKLHFLLSEFAGGIILLILIETLFKRLYRLWYASPED